jgi:hypothetical protein
MPRLSRQRPGRERAPRGWVAIPMIDVPFEERNPCANGCPPWRKVVLKDLDQLCERCVIHQLNWYDSWGDGPAVNAICWYGRRRFGSSLRWG